MLYQVSNLVKLALMRLGRPTCSKSEVAIELCLLVAYHNMFYGVLLGICVAGTFHVRIIRESVDSLCRDGADTPMPPYI